MTRYNKIGKAAEILGVSIQTIRRWELNGTITPIKRTFGGTRYYDLNKLLEINTPSRELTIAYARVSVKQKQDLTRQAELLSNYCISRGWTYEVIQDLGSGMNYYKKGLKRLLDLILEGKICRLVLTHKDRLLTFGAELIFSLCQARQVEIIIINQGDEVSFEEELAKDVLEIITIQNNKPLKKKLKRLGRLQRRLSRRVKGSNNRTKVKTSIAKLHYNIACNRNDTIHKLTTTLTENYRHIVIEDLDVSKMVSNKRLARSISDGGFYELRRRLCYKAELRGNKIYIADKWYASSKKCSSCGHCKKDLQLSEWEYQCSECGLQIDRDINAAKYLVQLLNTVSSTEIDACRQDGSVIMLKTLLQPAWMKQELSPI